MKAKAFDSVEMMRRLRDELTKELAALTPRERAALIHKRASEFPIYRKLTGTPTRTRGTRGAKAKRS